MANNNQSLANASATSNETQSISLLIYDVSFLPYIFLAFIQVFVGFIGNTIIITTIIFNKHLHTSAYGLIVNLSLIDLIISGFLDGFSITGLFVEGSFFDQRPMLCEVLAAVCLISCSTAQMNIIFLGLNRYICVFHKNIYKKVFNTKTTFVCCVIAWLVGFFLDVPNFTGWGSHSFEVTTLGCVWNRLTNKSYSIFFPLANITLPCVIVLLLYSRIFLFSPKWISKVNPVTKPNEAREIRLAKSLFVSFIFFAIFWLPYSLIILVDFEAMLPKFALMYSMVLAHFHSSLNAFIYIGFNSDFRRGFLNVCTKLFNLRSLRALRNMRKSNNVELDTVNTIRVSSSLNLLHLNEKS